MKRYKLPPVMTLPEDPEGQFVLFEDANKALAHFFELAVEAGADGDKLLEMMEVKDD